VRCSGHHEAVRHRTGAGTRDKEAAVRMVALVVVSAAAVALALTTLVRALRRRQLRVTDPDGTLLDVAFVGGPYDGEHKRVNAAPRLGAVIPAMGGTWIGLTKDHGPGAGQYEVTDVSPDGATAGWHPRA
jgi:hypothetical protein